MRPIKASIEAINELELYSEGGLLGDIQGMADRVQELVPECVGLSLASTQTGVTLTLVASDDEIAALDALQYVSGGPCVEAADEGVGLDAEVSSVLDERGWQLYAQGAAAAGVASSLTLPILRGDEVVGTVNLYASGSSSFRGREEEMARVLGAWAGGAVSNADLSFRTRTLAERAPQVLEENADIDAATGMLSMMEDVSVREARERLREAALRAGIPEARVAKAIISLARGR
ncbi:MAG: hypothetical protein AVDCRST_MAG32-2944 [uncultured Nocardioides sp.]|uniref:ANTAR domain-containing protein n=1 Tax=uncultured Nocardioides sp. TaxID=198441 RepID=A0A6J4NXW1_9ACTN|nr:MAG: hypothetical protein AVDCRST_MAG32-2944 [uncultured Nocardioides sp.]